MHEQNKKFGHFLEKHCSDLFTLNKKTVTSTPNQLLWPFKLHLYRNWIQWQRQFKAHTQPSPDVHTFTHARKSL